VLSDAKTGNVFYEVNAASSSTLEHYGFSEEMQRTADALEKLGQMCLNLMIIIFFFREEVWQVAGARG
jgi:hypothetical protein